MLTRKNQVPTYPVIDWNRPLFRPSVFDDVLESFFSQTRSISAGPRFASHDRGAAVVLCAEVPGMSDGDVQISCEKGTLTVSGERKIEAPEGYQVRTRERMPIRFSRSFDLSPDLDVEKADAKIQNGVLTVVIPRHPEAQPPQIPIKTT
jgi:HSP20 family protein